MTTLPPSVSRLSRQCGILNISQPCVEQSRHLSCGILDIKSDCLKTQQTKKIQSEYLPAQWLLGNKFCQIIWFVVCVLKNGMRVI
jgi:hypothetical protein